MTKQELKRLWPFLLPVIYAVSAGLLLLPQINPWISLQAFYVISWPASHLYAFEAPQMQFFAGIAQWAIMGTITYLLIGIARLKNR
jgi:hypothetical protein